jgi:DNA-binding NarL/FixJ family response regulator
MPAAITVLVVDRPTLSRRCLAAVLSRRRGLQVIAEAQTGSEALGLAQALRPDVAVVETGVPGGWQLVADFRREVRDCAVIVLTMGGGEGAASRALHAGARGYIEKSCEPDDLVRTIQRVHHGELVVAPVAPELLKGLGKEQSPSGLTERELDALRLVSMGQTNQEIAQQLGITEHTAKEHVANILDKLGLSNRVQIATYAVQHGLAAQPEQAAGAMTL